MFYFYLFLSEVCLEMGREFIKKRGWRRKSEGGGEREILEKEKKSVVKKTNINNISIFQILKR